eukprot:scaffold42_cov432-Pavlova_lutheri.AAC.7
MKYYGQMGKRITIRKNKSRLCCMIQFRTYMTSSSNSDRRSEPGESNGQRGLPGSLRDPGLRD